MYIIIKNHILSRGKMHHRTTCNKKGHPVQYALDAPILTTASVYFRNTTFSTTVACSVSSLTK